MRRSTLIFLSFILVISILAIIMTIRVAPAPAFDPGFNTPTPAHTPTHTPEASPTPTGQANAGDNEGSGSDCTFPSETWRQYPDAWGLDSVRIGNAVYLKEDVLDLLNITNGDVRQELLKQLLTVVINQRYGANPEIVLPVISDATDWLNDHPAANDLNDQEKLDAITLAKSLLDFNTGLIGPGPCLGPVINPTPTPTLPPSPTATLSAAEGTGTLTPTPTVRPPSTIPPGRFVSPTPITPRPGDDDDRPPPPPTEPPPPTQPPPTQPPPPPPTQPPPTQPPPPPPTQPPPPTPTEAPINP